MLYSGNTQILNAEPYILSQGLVNRLDPQCEARWLGDFTEDIRLCRNWKVPLLVCSQMGFQHVPTCAANEINMGRSFSVTKTYENPTPATPVSSWPLTRSDTSAGGCFLRGLAARFQTHWEPISSGSLNVPIFHITQPLDSIRYMVYNGYFFRWCPIFPSHGTFTNPCFIKTTRCLESRCLSATPILLMRRPST